MLRKSRSNPYYRYVYDSSPGGYCQASASFQNSIGRKELSVNLSNHAALELFRGGAGGCQSSANFAVLIHCDYSTEDSHQFQIEGTFDSVGSDTAASERRLISGVGYELIRLFPEQTVVRNGTSERRIRFRTNNTVDLMVGRRYLLTIHTNCATVMPLFTTYQYEFVATSIRIRLISLDRSTFAIHPSIGTPPSQVQLGELSR